MRGRLSDLSGDPAEIFLQFGFPELKWLCLCFLFLASIFLVCSIFSLRKTSERGGLIWFGSSCTWALFAFAVANGGRGLWHLYRIAEALVLNQRTEGFVAKEYSFYVRSTYSSLDLAGYALVLGMFAYVGTHALHSLLQKKATTLAEPSAAGDADTPRA